VNVTTLSASSAKTDNACS